MIHLSREIRFSLARPENNEKNSWAGWPHSNEVVPYLTLRCTVRGEPNETTGYVCNIKLLDDLLRKIVIQSVIPKYEARERLFASSLVKLVFAEAVAGWTHSSEVISLELTISPFLKYTMCKENSDMISMTQQFEFSAAHRLHCDELSAEENLAKFGKCNNPEGHGHNYVIEVSVDYDHERDQIPLSRFLTQVNRLIIDRLDHKHLNRDVAYFKEVNPSVENIAIAIWNWLVDAIAAEASLKLTCIRVYETPKTWAEYRG